MRYNLWSIDPQKVNALRISKRISYDQLAQAANRHHVTVRRWCTGTEAYKVTDASMLALCGALGCDPSDIRA